MCITDYAAVLYLIVLDYNDKWCTSEAANVFFAIMTMAILTYWSLVALVHICVMIWLMCVTPYLHWLMFRENRALNLS